MTHTMSATSTLRVHPTRSVRRTSGLVLVGNSSITGLGKSSPSLAKWGNPYNIALHFATNEELFPKCRSWTVRSASHLSRMPTTRPLRLRVGFAFMKGTFN